MEIRFKRDTQFRKQCFVPESFAHPAKMDAQLLIWLVGHYTKPGEVILDPMAGSGTTMLACMLGRNVVLIELEDKYCRMCSNNWQIVKMHPQLGYQMGTCQIIQGDARNLDRLLADSIITSPPYSDISMGGGLNTKPPREGRNDQVGRSPNSASQMGAGHYVDKILTSPPYERSIVEGNENFEGIRHLGTISKENIDEKREQLRKYQFGNGKTSYSKNQENIGNLKLDSYLSAMLQVYQQCYLVLKPQGLMVLVTKNFIRDRKVVMLDEDTIKLCEQVGFTLLERYYRKLPSQSFWRIIYKRKYPEVETIDHEDVIVFSKPRKAPDWF